MSENQITPSSPRKTLEDLIKSERVQNQLAAALPRSLTPERFTRVLMTATLKNPQILECTQESIFKAIYDSAAAGLEIDGRRAHIVPLRNRKKPGAPLEANLWFDYKGIAELVMRSGLVSNIHADVVCENDQFEYDRGELRVHKIDFRQPRGKMYATYCIIRFKDGSEKVEVMGLEQVDAIRQRSMGKDADTWKHNYEEMAKKTVFRRASKWVPLSPESHDAIAHEDEAIEIQSEDAASEEPTAGRNKLPPRSGKKTGAAGAKEATLPPPAEEPKTVTPEPTPTNADSNERTETRSEEPAQREPAPIEAQVTSFEQAAEQTSQESAAQSSTVATPRTSLNENEVVTDVVQVVTSRGMNVKTATGASPSVMARIKGSIYEGDVRMLAQGVGTGNDIKAPPHWAPGKWLRVSMRGKMSPAPVGHELHGKIVVVVESCESMPDQMEEI